MYTEYHCPKYHYKKNQYCKYLLHAKVMNNIAFFIAKDEANDKKLTQLLHIKRFDLWQCPRSSGWGKRFGTVVLIAVCKGQSQSVVRCCYIENLKRILKFS